MILRIPTSPSQISPTGLSPSPVRLSSAVPLSGPDLASVLQPRTSLHQYGLDFSAFARHYSRNLFFSSGYLDVSLPRVPRCAAIFSLRAAPAFPRAGFPIRDICGSLPYHNSPQLFAVVHVLPRPLAPRHPPYALRSLTCCVCARQPRSCRTLLTPTAVLLYPIQFLMCHQCVLRFLPYSRPGTLPPAFRTSRRPGRRTLLAAIAQLQHPCPLPPHDCGPAWTRTTDPALSAQCSNRLSYRPSPPCPAFTLQRRINP